MDKELFSKIWDTSWLLSKGLDKPENMTDSDYKSLCLEECFKTLQEESNIKYVVLGDVVPSEPVINLSELKENKKDLEKEENKK